MPKRISVALTAFAFTVYRIIKKPAIFILTLCVIFEGVPLSDPDNEWISPKSSNGYVRDPVSGMRRELTEEEAYLIYNAEDLVKLLDIAPR